MSAPPPLAWLALPTEDLGRLLWQRHVRWPFPLSASAIGRWEIPFQELLGEVESPVKHRPRGEERLLDSLAQILREPSYCVYAIRIEDGVETYYAGIAGGEELIVVLDLPGEVHLARAADAHLAVILAAQLPKVIAAPTVRFTMPAQTAALLGAGVARQAPPRTLLSAMASAGVPDALARRVLAPPESIRASGTIGATRYAGGDMGTSPRVSSWTEMPDGGMISSKARSGEVVWEPLTTATAARAVAEALTGLGS